MSTEQNVKTENDEKQQQITYRYEMQKIMNINLDNLIIK